MGGIIIRPVLLDNFQPVPAHAVDDRGVVTGGLIGIEENITRAGRGGTAIFKILQVPEEFEIAVIRLGLIGIPDHGTQVAGCPQTAVAAVGALRVGFGCPRPAVEDIVGGGVGAAGLVLELRQGAAVIAEFFGIQPDDQLNALVAAAVAALAGVALRHGRALGRVKHIHPVAVQPLRTGQGNAVTA